MFKTLLKTFAGLFFLFAIVAAHATVVSSLYSVQVPVASRTTVQRNKALRQAFETVLIRVSGNSAIATVPQIKDAMKKTNDYVRAFSYFSDKQKQDNPLLFQVNFSQAAINSLLRIAGQPVWAKDRPLTLVWLVVRDVNGTQIFNENSNASVVQILKENAIRRGLPVLLPMMDLADMQKIGASDVWAPFIHVIEGASARYSPDETLVVRIDATNKNHIKGQWLLLFKDKQMSWTTTGANLATVVKNGVDNAANALAKQFAVIESSAQRNKVLVNVKGLWAVTDYAKVMSYLRGLTGVVNLEVLDISPTQASFGLTLFIDSETLQRIIKVGTVLKPVKQKEQQIATEQQQEQQDLSEEQEGQDKQQKVQILEYKYK
jgi:uncharacterized protein